MFIFISFVPKVLLLRRTIASSAALIREIEAVLLRLRSKYRLKLPGGILVRPQDQVARVTKVGCFQNVLPYIVKFGHHHCAGSYVLIGLYRFNQYLLQLFVSIFIIVFLYILH